MKLYCRKLDKESKISPNVDSKVCFKCPYFETCEIKPWLEYLGYEKK